jgi:uncharacterized protein YdaT
MRATRNGDVMPWSGKSFGSKHNKKLPLAAAKSAARQANAMLKAGVPEGEAIATANKRADKQAFGMAKLGAKRK